MIFVDGGSRLDETDEDDGGPVVIDSVVKNKDGDIAGELEGEVDNKDRD